MLFGQHIQPHGAVDPRARIPAAVGLVGVVCLHTDDVLPAVAQQVICLDIEVAVAVFPAARILPVEVHLGVAVHPFKFEDNVPLPPCLVRDKALFVDIVSAHDPARVFAARTVRTARFCEHCVMRERHRLPLPLPKMRISPIFVKTYFLHNKTHSLHSHGHEPARSDGLL